MPENSGDKRERITPMSAGPEPRARGAPRAMVGERVEQTSSAARPRARRAMISRRAISALLDAHTLILLRAPKTCFILFCFEEATAPREQHFEPSIEKRPTTANATLRPRAPIAEFDDFLSKPNAHPTPAYHPRMIMMPRFARFDREHFDALEDAGQ